jgi:aryl-alcohol dehydrogenase-like predicted oxidoreductase
LTVSEIAFGSWLTTSGGVARDRAIACVHRALDRGVTLIDTANAYGRGIAEQVIGDALEGMRRDSYVLATKIYFPMSDSDRGLSRAQITKQLDASLKRLKVDQVDLYQCHRYDPETPLEETMLALTDAVKAGKTRWLGFSEWPVDKIEAALAMSGRREIHFEPAPIFVAASRSRTGGDPALPQIRHFADRLVTTGAGRADRKIQTQRAASERQPRNQRQHGRATASPMA